MAHGHHHGHSHASSSLRSLTIALVLNAAYTLVEVIAAILAGSLSLLADAGHNLSDVVALAVAAGAVMLARRPTTPNRSFGFKRAEILAALFNAVSLIVIALIVFVGAARRFADPASVPGGWLIVIASIGLLVNAIGAAAVFRRGGEDINLRAAYIHLVGDALGSIAVIATGIVIVTTGWQYADPIMGVLIGIYLIVSSWGVLRESVLVLLESTPRGLDARGDREGARLSAGSRRSARSSRVADHERLSMPLRARPRARGRRLPRNSQGERAHAEGAVLDHAHDAPGRPRPRRRAAHDRPTGAAVSGDDVTRRRVTRSVVLSLAEIELRVSRSSGPGGQHANKTESRVEAVFDVAASAALSDVQKRRVITKTGPIIRAVAQDERSQLRNRELAIDRVVARLAEALHVERTRVPTKPSRAAKAKRVEAKKRRGETKKLRRVDDRE